MAVMPVQAVAFLTILNIALFAYSILSMRGSNHADVSFDRTTLAIPADSSAGSSADSGECWKSQLARADAIYQVRCQKVNVWEAARGRRNECQARNGQKSHALRKAVYQVRRSMCCILH